MVIGVTAFLMLAVMADSLSAQKAKARGKSYTKADVVRVIYRVDERTTSSTIRTNRSTPGN